MAERSEADIDLESVTKNADRLKLTGSDRDDYIHKHMRGYGYKSKRSYFKPDDEDEGSGFFGRRGRSRRNDDDDDDD